MYGLGIFGEKVTAFTKRSVKAAQYFEEHKVPRDIISQFRRSSTSIGANCSEAVGAQTQADYLTKLHIAYKEAMETQHWIEVLHDSNAMDAATYTSIQNDGIEICKLLATITKNIRLNAETKRNAK